MSSMWRFLSIPPATHEEGWWPTPRWALRRLAMYAITALSGGLLFVLCAALLAVFYPRGTLTNPTIPTETGPPTAPPDRVIQPSHLVAGALERVKLIAVEKLLENKDKDPHTLVVKKQGTFSPAPIEHGVRLPERCRQSSNFYVTTPQLPQSRCTVADVSSCERVGDFR